MTVSQTGRTTNSVTITVSGITSGDRATYIWLPDLQSWSTLWDAKSAGYVSDIEVVNLNNNNGDIKVILGSKYLNAGYKCVDLKVENRSADTNELMQWIVLTTILEFKYDKSYPKYAGKDIDITVSDMREINLFGAYIGSWIGSVVGEYYPFDGITTGDTIYHYYLKLPAQNISNAALKAYQKGNLSSSLYDFVNEYTSYIINDCVSGADFKALFFNGISYAINGFNISVSI